MRQPYRRHKGPHFSEATRLLWLVLEERGISHGQAARDLKCSRGDFTRIIYGDKGPALGAAAHIQEVWGINVGLWNEPPTEDFVLPALRPLPDQVVPTAPDSGPELAVAAEPDDSAASQPTGTG